MGEIRELQAEVGEWLEANFDKPNIYLSALVLVEEVGELARALAKGADDIRGGSDFWEEQRRKEAGDVGISLMAFCYRAGIDFEDALTEGWKIVSARKRGEHNPDE